jgi:hypothetical protein
VKLTIVERCGGKVETCECSLRETIMGESADEQQRIIEAANGNRRRGCGEEESQRKLLVGFALGGELQMTFPLFSID